uniref:Globin domain-containing protein n=1 Tax=Pyramimonas obovata TaxID=1411642 RepID=A0A7S0RX52_9CHLO|mmetsp:Transcript_7656/g.15582  ORF Transcript_7656/g.15582 Transcript_7656/m.15582 type:complete len:169 (+) Transcript_7656:156-662(+)|eukprot:CAMPEP_0118931760 /NCGR_PEP_ID=MMETSP1169-20130426/7986_1 /TAXON_ID=36882 /ORGANISM="Pyramimonas obovata, Strain CCMP722" /LENGTH=168 /DNA_ID=CAMNT_0006874295 /DNA_START=95 /DNA_END=601 /DNA_ORIENTATION=-
MNAYVISGVALSIAVFARFRSVGKKEMEFSEMKRLVEQSWQKVLPIQDAVPRIFYPKLFEIDPTTKPLFDQSTMEEQGKKLMKALNLSVATLGDLDKLVPVLADLGKRHAHYKVKPEHFDSVGAALIATLAAGLGDAFTPKVKQAWVKLYGIVVGVMKPAMEKELLNL